MAGLNLFFGYSFPCYAALMDEIAVGDVVIEEHTGDAGRVTALLDGEEAVIAFPDGTADVYPLDALGLAADQAWDWQPEGA